MQLPDLRKAKQVAMHRYLPNRGLALITTHCDDRDWATKTGLWRAGPVPVFIIRLGVEFIYYTLARHNKLPMPESRVLNVNGTHMWGVSIKEGRTALGDWGNDLSAEILAKFGQTFKADRQQIDAYILAVFLDVMLLNDDRTVSNVLHTPVNGQFELSYFDHEQSIGWKNDTDVFGKNRIKSPEEEYREMNMHLQLERKYHWGAKHTTLDERRKIFDSICLDSALLEELRKPLVEELKWISPFQFDPMKCGLAAWWAFLRAKSFEELDGRIFGD